MPNNQQTITITPGGFCPNWFDNTWPYLGNKYHASDMVSIDLTDPNCMTQGPGTADLTAGTQAGAVTTLITSILHTAVASDVTYAIGGAKIYKISSTAVTNDGTYPMTIDKGTVTAEDADDLVYYKSNLYVFYNHSGSAGDIAKITLSTNALDADWGSTVPTGMATLVDAVHYAINGGDDVVYFTNGQYIGTISGTTLATTALDFWTNSQVVSLTWNGNRVYAAVNRPNITGSNFNESGIYRWNGVSSSWEGDPIEVSGELGALYTKNGTTFVWHKDAIDTGGYWLSRINGAALEPLRRYSGSLPTHTQVGEKGGFLMWVSNNKVFMFGAADAGLSTHLFQYMSGKHATIGTISAPFGTILVSSNLTTSYALSKESGYTVTSSWKSMAFPVSGAGTKFQIDRIWVNTEQLSTGAKVDFTLYYDQGKSSKALTQIAYATTNKTRHKILNRGPQVENFRIDIDFTNGSIVNNVKIRSIEVEGHPILST